MSYKMAYNRLLVEGENVSFLRRQESSSTTNKIPPYVSLLIPLPRREGLGEGDKLNADS